MKRILIAGLLGAGISVFFTGCSSLVTSNSTRNIDELVAQIQETRDPSQVWEIDDSMQVPDYNEINEEDKFKNVEGNRAFKIKEGHSEKTEDMDLFDIGTYLEGGTFLYAYSTRVREKGKSDTDDREIVHCAAAYNYKTGDFKVFHENTFTRTDQNLESLYIQTLEDGSGDVFVYDNGRGYLYDSSLTLSYQMDIETFVRDTFKEGESGYAYSITATHALTDGNDRIYVDLTLEKTEISEVEDVSPDKEDDTSEEDADKEADELDKEVDEKTIELILVCDMKSISRSIDQVNLNFDKQVEQWKKMTEGKIFTEAPDAEADWKSVKESNPDQWGVAYLYGMETETWNDETLKKYGLEGQTGVYGTPVFQFKNKEKSFTFKDQYVNTFAPASGTYEGLFNLQGDQELKDVFVIYEDHYYELFGTVETLGDTSKSWDSADYDSETIKRQYTYQWTETSTDEEGNLIAEVHTETRTQSLSKKRKRDASLTGEYIIGYWTTYDSGLKSTIDVVKDKILCTNQSFLCWLDQNGGIQYFLAPGEDVLVEVQQDENKAYMIITLEGGIVVYEMDLTKNNWNVWGSAANSFKAISTEQMTQIIEPKEPDAEPVDDFYHDMHNSAEEKLLDGNVQSGKELIQGSMLSKVSVDARKDTLKKLENEGVNAGSASATGNGFLITSFANGLLYFDSGSGKIFQLLDGTWYETWKDGDVMISVGFSNENATYESLDVAFAAVKEYKIDTLYANGLNTILNSYTEEEEETETVDEESIREIEKAEELKKRKEEEESIAPLGTLAVDVVELLE